MSTYVYLATYVINSGRISLKTGNFQVAHTCIHVPIRPYLNSIWEIIKTSHVQIFFCFLVQWKESEKAVICRKKSGGHRA